jgi:hypothetical protein
MASSFPHCSLISLLHCLCGNKEGGVRRKMVNGKAATIKLKVMALALSGILALEVLS